MRMFFGPFRLVGTIGRQARRVVISRIVVGWGESEPV